MVKIACFIGLLVLINASGLTSNPQDAAAFVRGFLDGLQSDPSVTSKCETDLATVLSGSSKVVDDVINLVNGKAGAFNELVVDAQTLVAQLDPLQGDCNFEGLIVTLNKILGPDGYSIIMRNYFKNIQAVTQAIEGYSKCGDDFETCGLYAGELFRYLVGFTLQNSLSVDFSLMDANYANLLIGFIKGLQNDPSIDSQCVDDVSTFSVKAEKIGQDLEQIISGNTAAIFNLLNDLKAFQAEVPNFFEECNIVGLIDQIEVLSGPNGFFTIMNNYSKNQKAILADLAVTEKCEADFEACGVAIGDVVKRLVGWSIN